MGGPIDYSRREAFSHYLEVGFDGGFDPDFVLIDGRFRVAAFLTTLLRTRPGVKIVFDDYPKRRKNHVVEEFVQPWKSSLSQVLFVRTQNLNHDEVLAMRNSFLYVMD